MGPEIKVSYRTVAADGHLIDGEIIYQYGLITEEPSTEIIPLEPSPISAATISQESSASISWLQWLSLGTSIGIAITFYLKMRKK